MGKENFLLLSLDDDKTKSISNIVNNSSARKILQYLTQNEEATASQISKDLKLGLTTIQYNLEQLLKTGLIEWEHYHYSAKGKEVKHYKLANQYIIIAPKKDSSFLDKLKGIIPSFFLSFIGAGSIFYFSNFFGNKEEVMQAQMFSAEVATDTMMIRSTDTVVQTSPSLINYIAEPALMFLLGASFALFTFAIYIYYKEYKKNKISNTKPLKSS